MSTPSSSSEEFVSANVSPERNGSSSASGSDWHSAQEHLEQANHNSDPESTNNIESDPESTQDIKSDSEPTITLSEPTITLPTNNIPPLVMPSPPSPISGSPPPSPPATRPDSAPAAISSDISPAAIGSDLAATATSPDPSPAPIRSILSPTAPEFHSIHERTMAPPPPPQQQPQPAPPRPFRPYQTIPGDLSSAAPLPGYTPTPNPTANWNSRQTGPAPAPRPFRPYQTIPGDLSSAAPLPGYTPTPNPTANWNSRQTQAAAPRPFRPYQTIPGDLSSARPLPNYTPIPNPTLNFNTLHPTHLPTHNPLSGRPYYDNRTPNIPSHFVPLYGAAHGMFYDPLTRLFYGDGAARPTLERPGTGGEMPVEGDTAEEEEEHRQRLRSNLLLGDEPTDALHLQPRAVTAPAAAARRAAAEEGGATGGMQRFYYCACVNRWLAEKHDCPADVIGEPVRVGGEERMMPPLGTVPPGVIRPGDAVGEEEMTHEIRVGYLGYLTAEQRERVRREWGV